MTLMRDAVSVRAKESATWVATVLLACSIALDRKDLATAALILQLGSLLVLMMVERLKMRDREEVERRLRDAKQARLQERAEPVPFGVVSVVREHHHALQVQGSCMLITGTGASRMWILRSWLHTSCEVGRKGDVGRLVLKRSAAVDLLKKNPPAVEDLERMISQLGLI